MTALNKVDALDDEKRAEVKAALEVEVGRPVLMMSGVSGEGLTEALRALRAEIDEDRLRHKEASSEERETWQP